MKKISVSVYGLGQVGYPLTTLLRSLNLKVYAIDKPNVINNFINNIKNNNIKNKRIFTSINDISSAVSNSLYSFIIVPTKSEKDHSFDISIIKKIIRKILCTPPHINKKHNIIITSTINPGDCDSIILELEKKYNLIEGKNFNLFYSPWFITLGKVIHDIKNANTYLIGHSKKINRNELTNIINFYNRILKFNKKNIFTSNYINMEISKIFLNAFVTNKIAFANMIAGICERTPNSSASKILKIIGSDKRVGRNYFKPGTPFSGPCFPRDNQAAISFVKKNLNHKVYIPSAVIKSNNIRLNEIVSLIKKINIKNIIIIGMSYKMDTTNMDGAFGLKLCKKLNKDFRIGVFDKDIDKKILTKELQLNNKRIKILNKEFFSTKIKNKLIITTLDCNEYNFVLKKVKDNFILDCWGSYKKLKNNNKYITLGEYFEK
jgi:UDPglucose 6-dehydrogenase